ncbi:hypothetical protein OHS33_20560 [Streptomyces sp. NBC_00536]|uniref:hypothetical protein n=1 Tax=Streptomyces sp. NBC_00536 TaxID=2975769 RepID=UPI002E801831|nr:hypothetical protein [Streptomyces sp. NBC_00536]WUC80505.1 hypothetical protein OHS33_20560 [Streptomyces sp. NBC_00536]
MLRTRLAQAAAVTALASTFLLAPAAVAVSAAPQTAASAASLGAAPIMSTDTMGWS